MLRILESWIDHLLTEKMRMKEYLHGHPIIIPDLEYFPTEFIQILKQNGECLDGLITYNFQSNHSFGVNLEPFKQDHYYTIATNIEGNLVNKWKLQSKFNIIHTVIKENESTLRLEVLTLEVPSTECDIPKALRVSFLQKWTGDPVNERLGIPHILLGNNYKQHHPKPLYV